MTFSWKRSYAIVRKTLKIYQKIYTYPRCSYSRRFWLLSIPKQEWTLSSVPILCLL